MVKALAIFCKLFPTCLAILKEIFAYLRKRFANVHGYNIYAIPKLIVCCLEFDMMWGIKMVKLFGKSCLKSAT